MQPWAVISAVVGVIALMFAIFMQLTSSVDQKIETKLKDPNFIRKVAAEIRLPFVIFDEDKSVIADTGAMNHIESIVIRRGDRQEVSEVIISPKKFMAIAPILENIDGRIEFENAIRGQQFDFIYKKVQMATVWADTYASGHPPKRKFRLQLTILPTE